MASSILSTTSPSRLKKDASRETDPLIAPEDDRGYLFAVLAFVSKLCETYGWKLLVLIISCQAMTTGFIRVIAGKNGATLYLFRDYQLPASTVQMYQAAFSVVWTLAPVIGLLSDALPINGYNKAPYVVVTSILSLIACITLWYVPETSLPVKACVVCIFVIMLQIVTADTCTTGSYTHKARRRSSFGADLMIFVSMGIECCGFLGGIMSGIVIEDLGPKACYGICALPVLACILVSSLGFFEEQKATPEKTTSVRNAFWDQKEVGGLAILMSIAAIFLICVNVAGHSVNANAVLCLAAALAVLVSYSLFLTPTLAKMCVFAVLFNAANLTIDGAMFYFYTDDAASLPDGPHFTATFYNSVRAPLWSFSGVLGIYLYKRYMKDWPYRKQVFVSNLFYCAALFLEIIIVLRVNLRFGISDHAFFLMITVINSITYQWQRMPFRICFMYLCPNNMETTVYALLSGCSDFGGSLSLSFGAVLLSGLRILPDSSAGDASRLNNLPLGIAIAAVAPMLAAVLFQQLLPDAYPEEHLVDDAVAGALVSGRAKEAPTESLTQSERVAGKA